MLNKGLQINYCSFWGEAKVGEIKKNGILRLGSSTSRHNLFLLIPLKGSKKDFKSSKLDHPRSSQI